MKLNNALLVLSASISAITVSAHLRSHTNNTRALQDLSLIEDTDEEIANLIGNSNSNDLGVRFNKIPYINDEAPRGAHELLPTHYPLSRADSRWLRQTQAISVFTHRDCIGADECEARIKPNRLVRVARQAGLPVTHPSSDPKSDFWVQLEHVVDMQLFRRANGDIREKMDLPSIWDPNQFDIHAVAEAVHDEVPGSIHIDLIRELFGGALDRPYAPNCATCANVDRTIIPSLSQTEFIRGVVMLSDLNTWSFGAIGPNNFMTKWFVGRARPEEVMYKIYKGEISQPGPSAELIRKIKNDFGTINRMQEFTAYEEGSPDHPSWPAMHSASSAASLWMAVVLDLDREQHCRVKAVDYAISYARTVAGVHYPDDNFAGLVIGQEVMAVLLPRYLSLKYGADEAAVAAKVAKVRFDWTTYFSDGVCNPTEPKF